MVAVSFNDYDSYHYVLTEWRTTLHNNFPKSLCQLHPACACLKWSVSKRPIRLHCFLLTSTSPSGQINSENTEAYKGRQRYCISHLGITFKFTYLKTHFLQANPHMTASTPRESAQHFLVLCDLLATKYTTKQAIRYHCPNEHQWMLLYLPVAIVKTHFLQANPHMTASTPRESAQHFLVLCDQLATKYTTKQAIRYHCPNEHQWMLLYFPFAFVKTHFLQANLHMTASTPRESAQHFLVLCDLLATKYKSKQAMRYHCPQEHQWMLLYFPVAFVKTHFLQANLHTTVSTPRESAQHFLVLCDLLATKYKTKQAIRYHCPNEHQWMLLYFPVAFVKTHFLQANLHTTASTPRESAQHFLVLCDLLATRYKTKQAIRYHCPYEHQWMLLYFPVAFVETHFLQANPHMTASTPRESAQHFLVLCDLLATQYKTMQAIRYHCPYEHQWMLLYFPIVKTHFLQANLHMTASTPRESAQHFLVLCDLLATQYTTKQAIRYHCPYEHQWMLLYFPIVKTHFLQANLHMTASTPRESEQHFLVLCDLLATKYKTKQAIRYHCPNEHQWMLLYFPIAFVKTHFLQANLHATASTPRESAQHFLVLCDLLATKYKSKQAIRYHCPYEHQWMLLYFPFAFVKTHFLQANPHLWQQVHQGKVHNTFWYFVTCWPPNASPSRLLGTIVHMNTSECCFTSHLHLWKHISCKRTCIRQQVHQGKVHNTFWYFVTCWPPNAKLSRLLGTTCIGDLWYFTRIPWNWKFSLLQLTLYQTDGS